MDFKSIFYPESRFGGFSDIDGTMIFFLRVNALVKPTDVILDIGCGRGAYADDPVPLKRQLRVFKGRCRQVIGIDMDPAAGANPFVDEFRRFNGDYFPVEDATVDVGICNAVLEHVENPDLFFFEIARVLKPGGYLFLKTANIWSYVWLASRLIPNRFHVRVLKRVQGDRAEEEVFPTLHRCNSLGKIRAMLSKFNFDHCVYGYEAEPGYLNFSRFFYFLGVLHQRFAPKMFRPAIHVFARKKE
jgi:SAM-dependent methyltransferase